MPRKRTTGKKRPKTRGNALPRTQVKPEKQVRKAPLANTYNTLPQYRNVPVYYSQFGANTFV